MRLICNNPEPTAVEDLQPASDSEDEDTMLAAPWISFHRVIRTPGLVAHIPSVDDSSRLACKRLRNAGYLPSEMEELCVFPSKEQGICQNCRQEMVLEVEEDREKELTDEMREMIAADRIDARYGIRRR